MPPTDPVAHLVHARGWHATHFRHFVHRREGQEIVALPLGQVEKGDNARLRRTVPVDNTSRASKFGRAHLLVVARVLGKHELDNFVVLLRKIKWHIRAVVVIVQPVLDKAESSQRYPKQLRRNSETSL